MNHQARSNYASILNEDWLKLGHLHDNDPGLTRGFHPLLQRTNASRPSGAEHLHTWPQFKTDEHKGPCAEMDTIFPLASNLLESRQSLEIFYQVAYRPRNVSDKGLSNQGRPCEEFGWTEPPSKGYASQMARDALRRLSQPLSFQWDTLRPILASKVILRRPTHQSIVQQSIILS